MSRTRGRDARSPKARVVKSSDRKGGVGLCQCGKWRFLSRKEAKRHAKALYPGQDLRVFECDEGLPGVPSWHYRYGYIPEGEGTVDVFDNPDQCPVCGKTAHGTCNGR